VRRPSRVRWAILRSPTRAIILQPGSRFSCLAISGPSRDPLPVLGRRAADHGSEVVDKVSLIKVAELQRQLRPIQRVARIKPFDQLMQAVPPDHPFWADPDILAENPLHRTLGDTRSNRQILHRFDIGFRKNAPDQLTGQPNRLVRLRYSRTEECIGGVHLLGLIARPGQGSLQGARICSKEGRRGNGAIGESGCRGVQKWMEAAGGEFDPEDTRLALQPARKSVGVHAADRRSLVLPYQMKIGMRQSLLQVWLMAAQIPADHPVVGDPVHQVGGRPPPQVPELAGGRSVSQEPSSLACLGIEDLRNLGCDVLSRFSNHDMASLSRLVLGDKLRMNNLLSRKLDEAGTSSTMQWKILTGPAKTQVQSKTALARSGTGLSCGAARAITWIYLLLGFGSWAHSQAASPAPSPVEKEAIMTVHAAGTFEVKLAAQRPDSQEAESAGLGRMSIDKQFYGDLEATSKGEMLSVITEVKGSAGYVAIERVSGTMHGRSGSFVLQHTGTMTRGTPQMCVTVVPDSASGQLLGLAGKMTIKIAEGKHFYELDYTLPETSESPTH
jgi:hypothetical protein